MSCKEFLPYGVWLQEVFLHTCSFLFLLGSENALKNLKQRKNLQKLTPKLSFSSDKTTLHVPKMINR